MTTACLLLLSSAALFAQSAEPKVVFEVASIKPGDPDYRGSSWNSSNGRLTARGMTLKRCVMIAYDAKAYQITGGPKWLDSERYDIVAKIEDTGEKPPRGKR